jgi:chemotaxis protein methyltransferase CheR
MQAWSSPGLARIADIVRERTGLVFPAARMVDVEAVVRRAMARRRIDAIEALADLLEHDARVRDSVVAELTIGETYFNRDGAQFELLRTKLMPHLLGLRGDRPVRVWSAGCASGEEPYSIAMLLSELDAEGRAEIVGTDISRQRLQDAQRAIYSKWSLRGMPLSLQQRYFMPRGRYHELRMHIRAQVDFRYLNLAEDHFPSLSAGIWGMDVILCRNVLIYFDRPTVEAVARRLIASLSEDG